MCVVWWDAGSLPQNLTLVSGIWDLGRDKIQAKPGWDLFRRPFTHYTDKFKLFLEYKFPKIVFLDPQLFEELKADVRVCARACSAAAARRARWTVCHVPRSRLG